MQQPQTVWDAVGNTPLLRIGSLSARTGCEILAKAEFMNPGGSIKDRAAKSMIAAAEASGALKPGGTIIEGTAGNTGIGLAMLGRARGYRVIVTMPENQAREKFELLEAMGAEIVKTQVVPFANPQHFFHQAKTIAEANGYWWANQFENTANADVHAATTGPELIAQAGGPIDVMVASAGTGGTIGGVSEALKAHRPETRILLADCGGSGLYNYVTHGEMKSEGSSITEGMGIMRVTANFRRAKIDDAVQISDQAMIEMLYHLAREDGLVVGTSAALNVRAAYDLALQHRGSGMRIVTLLCDHGSRYTSKIFDAAFLASKNLVPRPLA